MSQIIKKHHKTFEGIRQKTKEDGDFWSARVLQIVKNHFAGVGKMVTTDSGAIEELNHTDHFSYVGKMVNIGLGAGHHILFRCYVIVQ